MNVTVIFDGYCGMCTRTVRYAKKLDRKKRVTFIPCQSLPEEGWHGINQWQCNKVLVTRAEDGTVALGGDAMMLMFAAALGTNLPVRFGKLPVVRKLMRRSYSWVARNRRRFPGDMPWCQQHPEDCQPDGAGRTSA